MPVARADLLGLWRGVRGGTLAWQELRVHAEPLRRQVKALLEEGAAYQILKKDKSPRATTARACRNLLKMEAALWPFVYEAGIPPSAEALDGEREA